MTTRLIALFALLTLAGFLLILLWKLQRIDITLLVLFTLALASWDFLTRR